MDPRGHPILASVPSTPHKEQGQSTSAPSPLPHTLQSGTSTRSTSVVTRSSPTCQAHKKRNKYTPRLLRQPSRIPRHISSNIQPTAHSESLSETSSSYSHMATSRIPILERKKYQNLQQHTLSTSIRRSTNGCAAWHTTYSIESPSGQRSTSS